MSLRRSLHQSTLSMLSKCGMMAYFRYVEGIKAKPGVALIVGSATHKSHEINLKGKARGEALMSPDAVAQATADAFDAKLVEEGVQLDDDETARGEAQVLGEAKDQSIVLAGVCATAFAPRIAVTTPDDVERQIQIEMPSFPFDLQGTLDIYERAARRIVDTKTSKSKPNVGDLEGNIQAQFYTFAASKAWPTEAPQHVAMHFAVKTKTPQAYILEAPAPTDFGPLFERIERAADVFEKGAFYPVDSSGPSAWICSKRFCGYFDHCPFGKRARISVSMSQVL